MKKVFIIGICFCLLLTSCGKSDNKEETTSTNAITECTTVTENTTEIITEATTQNIQEKEGNYYVYTIGSFEMIEYEETLEKYQQTMLEELNRHIHKFMQTKVYKFGCTDDGDVYLKSVDKKYLIADNAEYNFIIESDKPVEVENKKASTEEYKIIDKLPDGTKILVGSKWERIGWTEIITEDYLGFVETKYIKEIAG